MAVAAVDQLVRSPGKAAFWRILSRREPMDQLGHIEVPACWDSVLAAMGRTATVLLTGRTFLLEARGGQDSPGRRRHMPRGPRRWAGLISLLRRFDLKQNSDVVSMQQVENSYEPQ
jgi:hypothetical protein